MSRPSVFNSDTLRKLEEAFALGCTDEEACIYADISPSSLYKYQSDNEEFSERKRLLRQKPILEARMSLMKGLRKSPVLALKFLERRARGEFALRMEYNGQPPGAEILKADDDLYREIVEDEYKRLFFGK